MLPPTYARRKVICKPRYDSENPQVGRQSLLGYGLRGLTIQMTNPKALLSWIAIISLGLNQGAPLWVGAVIVIGTFLLSLTIHALYTLAFSTPIMVSLYAKGRRFILRRPKPKTWAIRLRNSIR